MISQANIQREILLITDIPHVGLTTYDAKDPDRSFIAEKPFHITIARY